MGAVSLTCMMAAIDITSHQSKTSKTFRPTLCDFGAGLVQIHWQDIVTYDGIDGHGHVKQIPSLNQLV